MTKYPNKKSRILVLAALSVTFLGQSKPPTYMRPSEAIASAFPDYKFAGPLPAPVRTATENWAGARQRIADDPRWRSWVFARKAVLDDWIATHHDRADWIAGWGHDYINLETGLPILWSSTLPEPPVRTLAEQKVHRAWVASMRGRNGSLIGDAVRIWRITGDARYLEWASAQLDLYANSYELWPIQNFNGRSQMMGQSLDEATLSVVFVDAVRIMGEAVPLARRRIWDENLFRPMLRNIEQSNAGFNNIAVWQAAAAAMLALEINDEGAYRRAINGRSGIRQMLDDGILSDYLWFEPSVGYGQYTLRALGSLFSYLSMKGHAQDVRREMLLTQDMLISQSRLRFSDGRLPATGDSETDIRALNPDIVALTQPTMPIKSGNLGYYWSTLLDPDMPSAPAPEEKRSIIWLASQQVMLRRNNWELFTRWGQQSESHAQGDALSYELRYRGTALTSAAGTANYGSALFLNYLRVSSAHNMPMIDGEGQLRPGLGVLLKRDNHSVTATNPGFNNHAVVRRQFEINPRGAILSTEIRITTRNTHRLGDIFNTTCLVAPDVRLVPTILPTGRGLDWLRRSQSIGPVSYWATDLNCDGKHFTMALTADGPGLIYVASAPDRTGGYNRTAIYFERNSRSLSLTVHFIPR